MTFAKHYLHYGFYHKRHKAIIAIIVLIFFCVYRLTKVVFGLDTGFNWRKSFFYTRASCRSKNIVKSRWWVHLRFGWHPSKTCVKHRLWPSAGQRRGRYGAAYSAQSLYPPCTAGRTERNRYSPCRADDSMAQTWRSSGIVNHITGMGFLVRTGS